jgi:serine/threonine-protein kinase
MSMKPSQTGTVVADRYRVERVLGHGGMAAVYLAQDQELARPVALKLLAEHLSADPSFHGRFLREAQLAARLSHPNVVHVYDVGDEGGRPYIVMEYVDGKTVAADLEERRRFGPAEAVAVALQVCAGLEAAHAAGLVHRDIKPQNLLRNGDGIVKVADFGIARSLEATRYTEQGSILGTAAYLAPEQAAGEEVTAAVDLYALGVVLYELLTGTPPHNGETLPELLIKQREQGITPVRDLAPEVPVELEAAVMHALARNPDFRPASAAAFAAELASALPELATQPLPQASGVHATDVRATAATVRLRRVGSNWGRLLGPGRRRRVWLAAALGVVALAVVVTLALATGGGSPAGTPPAAPRKEQTALAQARALAQWLRANAAPSSR